MISTLGADPSANGTTANVYGAFQNAEENLCNASYQEFSGIPKIDLDFHPNAAGHAVIAGASQADSKEAVVAYLHDAVAAYLAHGVTRDAEPSGVIQATACVGHVLSNGQHTWEQDSADEENAGKGENTTEKPTGPKTENPNTGDAHSAMPYLLLAASAGTIAIMAMRRKATSR